MSTRKISVIIPALNAAATIVRCLQSVRAQAAASLHEIILVDNGSTDETLTLVREIAANDPRIKLTKTKRKGVSQARNFGLSLAEAPLVKFLDADDYLLPNTLVEQLALMPSAGWLIGAYYYETLNGHRSLRQANKNPWCGLLSGGSSHLNAHLFARKLLLKLGGFDEGLARGEDRDLYFRLLKSGLQPTVTNAVNAVYLQHDGARLTTAETAVDKHRRRSQFHERIIDFLRTEEEAVYAANRTFFRSRILKDIRLLLSLDQSGAEELYTRQFPHGVGLKDLDFSLLPAYACCYPLFGFWRVEKVKRMLKRSLE